MRNKIPQPYIFAMDIKKERFKVIPAVYLILVRNEKILLLLRKNTGYQDGNYSLPAGHMDGGETALQALCREAQEEINITLDPAQTKCVHFMHRMARDGERFDIFFSAEEWIGSPINNEPHKCAEIRWASPHDLPPNMAPEVREAIKNWIAGVHYSDFG